MTESIKNYIAGIISKDDFVSDLRSHDIKIDAKVNTLIRNTEAGVAPKFIEFGKAILRQKNGTDKYNRVDKINVNDDSIVTTHTAIRSFGISGTTINEDTYDKNVKDNLNRCTTGGKYVPMKGQGYQAVN